MEDNINIIIRMYETYVCGFMCVYMCVFLCQTLEPKAVNDN